MVSIPRWITDGTAWNVLTNTYEVGEITIHAKNTATHAVSEAQYNPAGAASDNARSSRQSRSEMIKELGKSGKAPEFLNSGFLQENIIEPSPEYNQGKSEKVIGKGMSNIILGRDRSSDLKSGYGGQGNSHAGTIDIVTGLGGMLGRQVNSEGQKVFTNKNMFLDAARIYVSQKTDIDKNFGLQDGSIGSPNARSGIAMKADGVRIIGREGIKLVTSTDTYNSQGVNISGEIAGIDLIAGNETKVHSLEPLVKGTKMAQALMELAELVRDLNSTCRSMLITTIANHLEFATHIHVCAVGPTSPANAGASLLKYGMQAISYGLDMADSFIYDKNVKAWELNHLHPYGKGYINSSFNNTN
jgi:hypothetical protein